MYSGMLLIFAPLVIGYLLPFSQPRYLEWVQKATHYFIFAILLLMGLSLAALDNLGSNLRSLLMTTATFLAFISVANLAVLPVIDKFMPVQTENKHQKVPFISMVQESVKLVFVVGAGVLIGLVLPLDLSNVDVWSEYILLILLFLIGIQLRNSGLTLRQILLNKHGMTIALVIIISSWVGGLAAAWALGLPYDQGLAMASGFGWYSLAGILIGDAYGPVFGGAQFMLELARELIALACIPLLINRLPCTAIGYAGATAMDFTLPVIQSTGGIRCVPIAIVSGFLLSILVPVFILFFVSLT
ncbi:lysine exporter LysO family protein [Vibrio sp. SCSIO 43136]|uniref:lysine exporter LysO family protein n=1 Tax=Vibrio sp. SCSIO 43136 TaxID=2819101 RepID=UPI0020760964|nr:lysine exporter LysO family protein [Vibrio sp. SCSIO 43136]USD64152.1 lysine exporter LysO family protein [Vibrio sp. SCSIO 43136]